METCRPFPNYTMKRTILLSYLMLGTALFYAQSAPGFNKRFTTQYPNSTIYKVLVENDTIVTLGLGYKDTMNLEKGLILMKLDTIGNLLQEAYVPDTLFGGQFTLLLHIRYGSLLKTPDNGYIMNIVPFLFSHPVVLKIDHDFNIEFIKEYQVMNEGVDYMLSELKPISDGYLLHGSFKRSNGLSDGYVGNINFEGDSIWMKNYGSFGSSETVVDVKVINDTAFAVSMVYNIGTGSALSSIKIINQYGAVLQSWNSAPNPEIGYLRDILSADENGYLVYGLYPLAFFPPFEMLVQSTISRLDKDFNVLWSKRYGKEVSLSSEAMFYNFERTIDSNFIGVGKTFLSSPNNGPSYGRGWLMKFSPEGDSIWSRQDTSDIMPVNFLNQQKLGGVGVLSSGSIVAGGYVTKGQDDYAWLIKVTNDGCLDTLYCGLVSGAKETPAYTERGIVVYPNPASHLLTVESNTPGEASFEATILDMAGNKLATAMAEGTGKTTFAADSLPSGMYFIAVKFPDGKTRHEKICVVR